MVDWQTTEASLPKQSVLRHHKVVHVLEEIWAHLQPKVGVDFTAESSSKSIIIDHTHTQGDRISHLAISPLDLYSYTVSIHSVALIDTV